MRGRKPLPTGLHKVRGTYNATRHGKGRASEPVAEGDLGPAAPDWMTPDQKAGWRHALEHAPAGVLRKIDAGILAVWVIAESQHRAAVVAQARMDSASALPFLVKNKDGLAAASPYVGIINQSALRMLKAASELGFSPASRPRLGGPGDRPGQPPASEASPWDQFTVINGGRK